VQNSPAEGPKTQLSFCKTDLDSFKQWVNSLHKANLGETAKRLNLAVSELVSKTLEPPLRLAMLESLRPVIYFACQCLAKEYLHQPVLLPEKPRKIAELAQHLQSQLAQAYSLTAEQVIRQDTASQDENPAIAGLAIHRAISDLTQTLLRTYRLHTTVTKGNWQELHRLYKLAEQHDLDALSFADGEESAKTGSRSIRENYLHVLLLGCVHVNRLRQEEITSYYNALWRWVPLIHLNEAPPKTEYRFIVDWQSDDGPFKETKNIVTLGNLRYLDISRIVADLSDSFNEQQEGAANKWGLPLNVVNHLINSWGMATTRVQKRRQSCKHLLVSIGLYATHYHVAGGIPFKKIVNAAIEDPYEEHENPFLSNFDKRNRKRDVWDKAYEAGRNKRISGQEVDKKIQDKRNRNARALLDRTAVLKTEVVDNSQGGYGLHWPTATVPDNFNTGEILAVRESETDPWMLAAVRWVEAGPDQSLRGGLEIIAETAAAYGAQLLSNKDARSKFLRAFILPDDLSSGANTSIILPAGIAKQRDKLLMTRNGEELIIQLTKEVKSNGGYSRFEFQHASRLGELIPEKFGLGKKPDFDSVWDHL